MNTIPIRTLVGMLVLGLTAGTLVPGRTAEARGGRSALPAAARPTPVRTPDAPEATQPTPEPGPGIPEELGETPPTARMPTLPGVGRRPVTPNIGAVDWVVWYETSRERFEDLRARALATETNPIFQVGPGGGVEEARGAFRVPPEARARLLHALRGVLKGRGEIDHWIHTRAAAYLALGRVAETAEDLTPLFRVLDPEVGAPLYIRESAVLGLGHLRRSDPERRLGARLLDRARARLAQVLADGATYHPTTRAYAAVSLALLADQPSALGKDDQLGSWTSERLLRTWLEDDLPEETQVGVLIAVARLGESGVPPVLRLVLEGCALRGRDWPNPRSALVRAHAAIALAHVAGAEHTPTFERLLETRKGESAVLYQAAALAATVYGERVPAARVRLARRVIDMLAAPSGESGQRRLGLVALGRFLAADAPHGGSEVLEKTKAGVVLRAAVRSGAHGERPFAALALALAARAVPDEAPSWAWHTLRKDALEALRAGARDETLGPHTRAAFAAALGMAGDVRSVPYLLKTLEDEDRPPELRAYAALGLGLIGDAREDVVEAVRRAIRDPRDDTLRMRAATALGLLGGGTVEERRGTIGSLVQELRRTAYQASKGQFAITLGRIGGTEAIEDLIRVLEDSREAQMNRAMACAALGLIGEEERHTALAPIRWSSHYLTSSAVVRDLNDLL